MRHGEGSLLQSLLLTLTVALVIGMGMGLVGGCLQVSSNRYLAYGMDHLALLTFKSLVNQCLLTFGMILLVLLGCYLLIPLRSDRARNGFIWIALIILLLAIARLLIKWYAVPIATIPVWIRRTSEELMRLVRGQATLTHFMNYLRNRLAAGSLLVGIVSAIVILALTVRKFDLKGILKRWKRTRYLRLLIPLAILFAIINVATWIDESRTKPKGYNVVLIGIDTWRADHVSCFGYRRLTMPEVDDLASKGIVFLNSYSTTSWTLPSFLSILTSLYQSSHGVISSEYKLAASNVTLAEILRNRGYRTAGFISGTYLKRTFGFDQGFDIYEESVTNAELIKTYDDITSPRITQLVTSWLRKNCAQPFFVFAHYWDPHFDYIPPAPFDTLFDPDYPGSVNAKGFMTNPAINPDMDPRDLYHIISLYDGELRWTDLHIGKLVQTLDDLDVLDRTIIVLVGDHGEEFFEHGGKGHRNTLYNEVIHVPIIFWIPGGIYAKEVRSNTSTVDVMPTILDLLGIAPPTPIDGQSLVSSFSSRPDSLAAERPIYSELSDFLWAMIKGHFKIIFDSKTGNWELYDLARDPQETHNLASELPAVTQDLSRKLQAWITTQNRRKLARKRAIQDSQTRRQLKALGYIQ